MLVETKTFFLDGTVFLQSCPQILASQQAILTRPTIIKQQLIVTISCLTKDAKLKCVQKLQRYITMSLVILAQLILPWFYGVLLACQMDG